MHMCRARIFIFNASLVASIAEVPWGTMRCFAELSVELLSLSQASNQYLAFLSLPSHTVLTRISAAFD